MLRSAWLLWAALALVGCGTVLAGCGAVPEETPASRDAATLEVAGTRALLPDTGGRIERVAISVNSARRAALRNADLVTRIVNGLPASTEILLLTNDPSAFAVAGDHWPERIEPLEMPLDTAITIWTQDPFLVLDGPEGPTLLTSKDFDRAGDRAMAETIAARTGYPVVPSALHFEGGNVVSDREFVLIGANTIRRNAVELDQSEVDVVLQFQEELGRQVLVVGPVPQPIAHIDMMLTPLGDGRIALADAAAGARIAEEALAGDPESVEAFERWCEEYFFGHPSIRAVAGPEGQRIGAPQVRGKTREMIARSREIAPVLDGIARSLEGYGYRVERVPFLFGGPESTLVAGQPPAPEPAAVESTAVESTDVEPPDNPAAYPMLTYNNVLLEDDVDGPIVYLPAYGWRAMDEAAAGAWRAIGFSPRPIEGLTISAMYGGALRCSVKVLTRAAG